jgi:hypothetical protein
MAAPKLRGQRLFDENERTTGVIFTRGTRPILAFAPRGVKLNQA